ncbi:hypothetical protein CCMA1212_000455 [Trichoderma ghanense]|uniref:Uncharacterized protein n=1 Tax=Trichoderma ghanense TaxID=65468 RepID=A0ABY2HI00_9HYPO
MGIQDYLEMWAEPSEDAARSDAENHQDLQSNNAHPDGVEKLLFVVGSVAVEVVRRHGVAGHAPGHDGYRCLDGSPRIELCNSRTWTGSGRRLGPGLPTVANDTAKVLQAVEFSQKKTTVSQLIGTNDVHGLGNIEVKSCHFVQSQPTGKAQLTLKSGGRGAEIERRVSQESGWPHPGLAWSSSNYWTAIANASKQGLEQDEVKAAGRESEASENQGRRN